MSEPTHDPLFHRLEDAFHRASALAGVERERYLSALRAEDAELATRLDDLLDLGGRTAVVDALALDDAVLRSIEVREGDEIGRYRIVGLIGAGGMGTVWRAVQARPQRTVALKVIHPGPVSRDTLRRFELEAEILGYLSHPGIAEIYEAGVHDAARGPIPFFAMELIEGPTLTAWADDRRLDRRARVAVMVQVCEALAHAHQKGVIHRDLKPSNILVDESGRPRILDFGVARAVDLAGTEFTNQGQMVGTLAYMSPEQTELDPRGIDTRSDVYALGVILFQLLAGRLPHDVAGKAPLEVMRLIREEPARRLTAVARGTEADLEIILEKALERDRELRYDSAAALGDDLRRFLRREPIAARRPSSLYRALQFARRNRALVAALAGILVVLSVGLVGTWAGKREAERAAERAVRSAERERAAFEGYRAAVDFLNDSLAALDLIQSGREYARLEDFVDEIARGLPARLEDDAARIVLESTVGNAYSVVGQAEKAQRHLEAVLAAMRRHWGDDDPRVAGALYDLACHETRVGALESALTRVDLARRRHHRPTGQIDWFTVRCEILLGRIAFLGTRYDDTRRHLGLAATLLAAAEGPRAMSHRALIGWVLAKTDVDQGDLGGAIARMDASLIDLRAALGDDHAAVAEMMMDRAQLELLAGRPESSIRIAHEALARLEARYGDRLRVIFESHSVLGHALLEAGRVEEADDYLTELLAQSEQRRVAPKWIARTRNALARVRLAMGRTTDAEEHARAALDVERERWPNGHHILANSIAFLSQVCMMRGHPDEGEALAREADAMAQRFPALHFDLEIGGHLARVLRSREQLGEAITVMQRVVRDATTRLGPDHVDTLTHRMLLGAFLFDGGRFEAAVDQLRIVDRFAQDCPPRLRYAVALSRRCYGAALFELDRIEPAERELLGALDLLEKVATPAARELERDVVRWLRDLYETIDAPEKLDALRARLAG